MFFSDNMDTQTKGSVSKFVPEKQNGKKTQEKKIMPQLERTGASIVHITREPGNMTIHTSSSKQIKTLPRGWRQIRARPVNTMVETTFYVSPGG